MSRRQPLLLTVPPTAPSRRRRLTIFKREHGIITHYCGPMPREDHPWLACLIEQCRKFGYGVSDQSNLLDVVAKVGRLAEEAELLVTGTSECDAIHRLCEANGLPDPP